MDVEGEGGEREEGGEGGGDGVEEWGWRDGEGVVHVEVVEVGRRRVIEAWCRGFQVVVTEAAL